MPTGFLRRTARRIIRDLDNFQSEYPSLIRTSDPQSLGLESNSPYDDRAALIYSASRVQFPAMVPVAFNNLPTSTIIATAEINKTAVESTPSNLPGAAESFPPFNETTFYIPGTVDYITQSSQFYGFTSAVRDKIAIPINIKSDGEKVLFRLAANETKGEFAGGSSTGFVYYNFSTQTWDDIKGLSYSGRIGAGNDINGQNIFMSQFVGTSNLAHNKVRFTKSENLERVGYSKIGTPTNFFDAPHARRYHATNNQMLRLNQYIQQPFVLERIDVQLPFVARRKHGVTGSAIKEGAYRDIDNLVFFIYRQENPPLSNGPQIDEFNDYASSSIRHLFAYESLSFYNSQVNDAVSFTLHKPVFSYDHNLPLTSTDESLFTGSVRFSMSPKVSPFQYSGISSFGKGIITSATPFQVSQQVQNFWYGSLFQSGTDTNVMQQLVGPNPTPGPSARMTNYVQRYSITQSLKIDTDPRYLFAGQYIGSLTSGSTDALGGANSNYFASPPSIVPVSCSYLLLPTDSLVFGIEASVHTVLPTGSYDGGHDNSFLSQTGSFFKILNTSAQVTLFGSLIQNSVSKTHNSINQNLVSAAVHEIVTNVQDDTDQFTEITERALYYGSYLDDYITGSILNGTRGIVSSLTRDAKPVSGSFERFVRLVDENNVYYDNFLTTNTKPMSIYRPSHYGQYRDMLEQPLDSKMIAVAGKKGGTAAAINITFVTASTEDTVDPYYTYSNNQSTTATSSMPYLDGINTSRPDFVVTKNKIFTPTKIIFKT